MVIVLSLNPSKLGQLLPERLQEDRATGSSAWIQETDAKDFPWLLRLAAEKQSAKSTALSVRTVIFDFDSWFHSYIFCILGLEPRPQFNRIQFTITRSARINTFGGIVSPICLAALRLTMNSNLMGCSTGRSPGLARSFPLPHGLTTPR